MAASGIPVLQKTYQTLHLMVHNLEPFITSLFQASVVYDNVKHLELKNKISKNIKLTQFPANAKGGGGGLYLRLGGFNFN